MARTKYLTKALRCPDGTRKYIRGRTPEELDAKVRAARAELDLGININDDTTFLQFAQTWLDVYKRPHIKAQSAERIVAALNTHLVPYLGVLRMRDIRPAHISRAMSAMGGSAHGVQAAVLNILRAIFRCAVENNIILRSPVTDSIKAGGDPAEDREALTPEQCRKLLQAARGHSDDMYAFVLLGLYTGMRRGEIMGLCWDCVDLENRVIHVRRQLALVPPRQVELTETLKTRGSARDIPLPFGVAEYLAARKKRVGGVSVFPVLDRRAVERVYHCMTKLCRVKANGEPRIGRNAVLDFYCTPHMLRHTYATRLFEGGLDIKEIQYLLGHSTPAMTLRIYTHYDRKSRQKSTAERVEAALPAALIAL